MSSGRVLSIASILFAVLPTAPTKASAQELISASLTTITGSDDKDNDTGIYVQVFDKSQKTVLARVDNAANCESKDDCYYREESTHTIPLKPSPGITKAQCEDFKFVLAIQAKGSDQWAIAGATIKLNFSDGTTLSKTVYNVGLNSRHGSEAGTTG